MYKWYSTEAFSARYFNREHLQTLDEERTMSSIKQGDSDAEDEYKRDDTEDMATNASINFVPWCDSCCPTTELTKIIVRTQTR